MKCFAIFLLVGLAVVVTAQEKDVKISTLPLPVPKPGAPKAAESQESPRNKRGFLAYSQHTPYAYVGGYNGYYPEYRTSEFHYPAYPQYGYPNNFYYY